MSGDLEPLAAKLGLMSCKDEDLPDLLEMKELEEKLQQQLAAAEAEDQGRLKRAANTPHSAKGAGQTPSSAVPRARKAAHLKTPTSALKPTNLMGVLEYVGTADDDEDVVMTQADPYTMTLEEPQYEELPPQKLEDLVLTPAKGPASSSPTKGPASSISAKGPASSISAKGPASSILKGVETTPSILKGAEDNSPAPLLLRADTGSDISSASEADSAMMSMVQILQTQLAEQSKQNARLQSLLEQQAGELAKLRADQSSAANSAEEAGDAASENSGMTFEAARQRVRRLVKLRADGSCAVPQHVVEQWNKQGKAREQLIRVFMEQGCDKESFLRKLTIQNEREKELSIVVEGDFYTESQLREEKQLSSDRIAEIKNFAKTHPNMMRRDVYNPNMIKYFYEERAHATMRASALLRSRDETSMDMPVEQGEDGSVAVGQDVNLGDLGDASMVGTSAAGSGSGSTVSGGAGEADIQLPSLEGGKKASSVINQYMQAALQRSTKLGDALGKLHAVPPSEQTDAMKKLLTKMESTHIALEACQDAMQEIYCAGAVEGYSKTQDDELVKQYKTLRKLAMESSAFETRSKAAMPKRRAAADAKPKAAPKKASSPAGPAAKPKAEAPAGRKTGKQSA